HPEALVYVDGTPYAACDRHHQEVILADQWRDGADHRLALHGWTGNTNSGGPDARLLMRPCEIVLIDQPARDFIAAARTALGVAQALPESHPTYTALLNALDAAFKALDTREPFGDPFYASVPDALAVLRDGIAGAGAALDVGVAAAGHAHIDVAWLWTLGQTRRKAGRTFHTALRLMEQFPYYCFTQSQPQLYDYVRQDYPALFDAIKQRVSDGRWEPIGGMWVEADCNLSGAESLARQFVLGRSFFREHFGPEAESPVLWLPDVFGYAWSLPQLIKLAGLDYFYTIKIGWSQYNKMPYHSFWWQGIDGTRVLTHFSPNGDYTCKATPADVVNMWNAFKQQAEQRDVLMSYGYGDGGGGPTREMLETIRELGEFPGAPRTRHDFAGEFFRRMEAEAGDNLPTWNGELYLEYHRGTYTTQSRNKRANRKSEFLLHDAEFLAALAAQVDGGYEYPAGDLRKAWELVCLNQFHDIIPGSSIGDVYIESQEQYTEVAQLGAAARDTALDAIAGQVGGDLLLINPTSFARGDLCFWTGEIPDGQHLVQADGTPVFVQPTENGIWLCAGSLPPYSITGLQWATGPNPVPNPVPETGLIAEPTLLENRFLRVEFNPAGDIVRMYDKVHAREVLPDGAVANQFQAFEDRPPNWDAWDIEIYYDDKLWLADPADSMRVIEAGPLRATLEIKRRILNSAYTQRISLDYSSPVIRFDTDMDWHERHILLKVAFPVDILAPQATYDIQWGNVQRPTHRNTSWDWARFETAAQKWADLSEGNYGVSLLNDCKYGHDIRDNVIRLSLLRGTTKPDPDADQGQHQFTYALLPHAGDWTEETIPAAYALNDPALIITGRGGTPERVEFLAVDRPNVVIETVKRADDGNGLIVRLYESQRQRGPVTLTAHADIRAAAVTNLLEDTLVDLTPAGRQVTFDLAPYQIMTLRLVP
ncbi:MAG: alpha-mannosidase, partial [Anaerolineae bacterium]|nr:alpha-mannosidase [Anaerolineae bacterium]